MQQFFTFAPGTTLPVPAFPQEYDPFFTPNNN
jgi:hypothetical protein